MLLFNTRSLKDVSATISTASPTALVNYYNDALSSCLEVVAPRKSKLVSSTHSAPWYTDRLRHLKARAVNWNAVPIKLDSLFTLMPSNSTHDNIKVPSTPLAPLITPPSSNLAPTTPTPPDSTTATASSPFSINSAARLFTSTGRYEHITPTSSPSTPHTRCLGTECRTWGDGASSAAAPPLWSDDKDARKGQVLTLLAEQALQCLDFKACSIHCRDLMAAGMADAHFLPSEDQFLCSICLDVFTDPVTTPCGHNFCKKCINDYWNTNNRNMCPLCKKVFMRRPELHVNTFISEMVSQFRQSTQRKARSSREQVAKPGEVPCDVCTGTKLKALKSCLVCLASYCETHLEGHLTASRLKRHQLMDPVENLEDRMCLKHDKPLELFCRTDQTCVCMLCTVLDHKMHNVVPLGEEYEGKLAELGKTEAEIQQMILKRQVKIQEIRHSVNLSEEDANREIVEGIKVFTDLKDSVERGQANLINTIRAKQRKKEKQAEVVIRELNLDISKLLYRRTAVERLSRCEDHLHLLQGVQSLNIHHPPPTKDWSQVSVPPASHEGTVRRAVSQLEETLSRKMKTLFKAEKFAVDVTLDPETANPELILSDDGKQVKHGDVTKNLPDNPERFSYCNCVLAKESFSSGRFYYEVQVKDKTDWDVGVVRESINRKGDIRLSPEDGCWIIWLANGNEYEALDAPSVSLSLRSRPQKVGVFVDYEEGLVSFYDVEAAALIYSFTGCSFKEKLHPYFSPDSNEGGKNSAPLIISPVRGRWGAPLIPAVIGRGAVHRGGHSAQKLLFPKRRRAATAKPSHPDIAEL
ncbi:E3 ubiquitin-protein ligase TRIM39 [Liparis tanakae]|uniref:E3 ubiquitin-protein ligase TRIM39 n=1 Tax=Liparis tanakae TaxID=230148 RepID=A0A4Z2G9D8_9TELE|nr:E3 ubiquitin-protein ligase TRIM39 [Liparis tanakae]